MPTNYTSKKYTTLLYPSGRAYTGEFHRGSLIVQNLSAVHTIYVAIEDLLNLGLGSLMPLAPGEIWAPKHPPCGQFAVLSLTTDDYVVVTEDHTYLEF